MAEYKIEIRPKTDDGTYPDIAYPKTTADMVFDEETGQTVAEQLENLKQSGLDGKNQLETAIKSKDGTVSKAGDIATFDELESGIISIPQAKGNATRADVLSGRTFSSEEAGIEVTGTMTNRGAVNRTLPLGGSYTIPRGYHNGSGRVRAESDNIILAEGVYSALNYTAHEGDFSLGSGGLTVNSDSIITSTSTISLNNVKSIVALGFVQATGYLHFGVCTYSERSGTSFTAYRDVDYKTNERFRTTLDVSDLTGNYYLKFRSVSRRNDVYVVLLK